MNFPNKKEKSNKFQEYFSWINSIPNPLCQNCSSIKDLKDGNVFLAILKYYYNYNNKNQNYLSLIKRINNINNPFERMNLIFHTMSKIITNKKIKSRIESFHNNINAFLRNDNLIMELVIYINYLFQKNKGDNRISKMTKQPNVNNTNKNHYCSQIKKKKRLLNLEEDDNDSKYKRKIINYNSVKNERNTSNNEKNNFLFYINNKNESIINIDNIMNFRFTKGINNLKTQNNNIHKTEEIKSYVTKPKIIKYKYNTRFFNNNPKDNNQNKKVRNIKSEINFNKIQKYFKNEENKKVSKIKKIKETKNIKDKMNNYHTNKAVNYNPVQHIIEEENKLMFDNLEKNIFKMNQENEKNSINENDINLVKKSKNIRSMSANIKSDYKLLKLTNNNIKTKDNENLLEEKIAEEKINESNFVSEDDIVNYPKRILYSRNYRNNRNKINQKSEKPFLNKNFELFKKKEIKRQISLPRKDKYNLNQFNQFTDIINSGEQPKKSHSYFHQNHQLTSFERAKKTKEEKIYDWLVNLKVIERKKSNFLYLTQLISDGKLLCDIINQCENENNQIKDISNDISTKENALINIKKALVHLNKIEDFPKNNIRDYELIFEIDNDTIWGLLNDLYNYYSDKVEIKNNLEEENNNEIIFSNINNSNLNNKNNEKQSSNNSKKSSIKMSDLDYNVNNIKSKIISHKNSNIKNILFQDKRIARKDFKYDKETNNSDNNSIKYKVSYNNFSIINNKENIMQNYSTNNIYKEEKTDDIKFLNNRGKKKNYFYYVNALKHYFDQEKNEEKVDLKNNENVNLNYNTENENVMTSYSNNKNEPLDFNSNNLYFNYSNSIYLKNNKKYRYSFNPINPEYYNSNNFSLQSYKNYLV